MARIFRWRPPPIGAALAFVGAIVAGALALMWTMTQADASALAPWIILLVAVVAAAGALLVRRVVMQPPVKRETRPPGRVP